jgi:hypothetical protein
MRSLALVPVRQLDDLAHPVNVGSEPDQHLGGHALAFPDQTEQDVLGPDVVVAQLLGLAQRELEHLLRAGRELDVPGRLLIAPANDLLNLLADRLQADPHGLKGAGPDALPLLG